MSLPRRRRDIDYESDDDEKPILQRWTSMNNRTSVVNPVIVGNDDSKAQSSFKRASTYVYMGNRSSVVNPVPAGNDEFEAPRSLTKATTLVKNRTWGATSGSFDNDDDFVPSSFRRASTSVKNMPTLSKQIFRDDDLDRQLDQWYARYSVAHSEGDEMKQKSEDHEKTGSVNGGRSKKKHKVATPIPATEDTMFMGKKASEQGGQQYSISRCLEVLHGMDDVSDEIKVLDSDVLKDEASREFFLCYDSRLRGLWLKKEVAKLGAQLPP